jgi:hypothetical protein
MGSSSTGSLWLEILTWHTELGVSYRCVAAAQDENSEIKIERQLLHSRYLPRMSVSNF